MLNKEPNNNDVTRIAIIVLNEAPNSNDTTHVGNYGRTIIFNGGYITIMQKRRLIRDEK